VRKEKKKIARQELIKMMYAVQSFQLKIVFENKDFGLSDTIERSKAAVQTNAS
jgi:hypothetical protein